MGLPRNVTPASYDREGRFEAAPAPALRFEIVGVGGEEGDRLAASQARAIADLLKWVGGTSTGTNRRNRSDG